MQGPSGSAGGCRGGRALKSIQWQFGNLGAYRRPRLSREASLIQLCLTPFSREHPPSFTSLPAPRFLRSIANPFATHEVNVTGTLLVLEAARRQQVRHVILASSSSVYGANPVLPKSEDLMTAPVCSYMRPAKWPRESYTLAWAHSFGLEVLVFRFFNVFGPLQLGGSRLCCRHSRLCKFRTVRNAPPDSR